MIWYHIIWYDLIWLNMIWYDMIWFGMTLWFQSRKRVSTIERLNIISYVQVKSCTVDISQMLGTDGHATLISLSSWMISSLQVWNWVQGLPVPTLQSLTMKDTLPMWKTSCHKVWYRYYGFYFSCLHFSRPVYVCLCVLVPSCAYFFPYMSALGVCLYEYILCHFIYLFVYQLVICTWVFKTYSPSLSTLPFFLVF